VWASSFWGARVVKKIVIFTCIGGHNSVSQSLKTYLSDFHDVLVLNFFLDVIGSLDPIRWLTGTLWTAEDYYSFCVRNQFHNFLNKTYKPGLSVFGLLHKVIKNRIKKRLIEEKIEILISVIPWFNDFFLSLAQELNITFILMPTDMEIAHFFNNISLISYKRFLFLMPFQDTNMHAVALKKGVLPGQIFISGVPLKEDFFITHNQEDIRTLLAIPPKKPVILLLMGSQGSSAMIDYAKKLSSITDIPFHLIMVLGANAKQRSTLEKILFGSLVSKTVLGFTDLIPQLMAISTLLITKSGGISISEAIYMNLPTLMDATSEVLFWEKANQQFMHENRFGTSIHCLQELPSIVRAFLTNRQDMLEVYKKNMQLFEKKHGALTVKKVLDELIIR
jgi:UDP-N-acetylglucosamine:LPS N-acetylglucosamine transferase